MARVFGNDRVYYIVIADLMIQGRCVSTVEDTHDIMTERQLIDFLLATENVQRIIEVRPDEHSSRDISEDIARSMVQSDVELNEGVREFLEIQLGCDVARQAIYEAAA